MPTTREGKCPKCLSYLTYLAREVGASCITKAVHCSKCGWVGEEIDEIEFMGHTEAKTPNKFLVQEGTVEAVSQAPLEEENNATRAARAETMLRAYATAGGERLEVQTPEEYLVDVVADLRHYAAREGCDWHKVEGTAAMNFEEERLAATAIQPPERIESEKPEVVRLREEEEAAHVALLIASKDLGSEAHVQAEADYEKAGAAHAAAVEALEAEGKCVLCGEDFAMSIVCGVQVCLNAGCRNHLGLARCFCGWARDGGDGRRELAEAGENVGEED